MTLGNEGTEELAPAEPVAANPQVEEEPPEAPIEEPAGEEPDDVEIDWDDGQKYRIPKALKDGVLRNKDYTQKTQAVAAERKAVEEQRKALEADTAARKEHIKDIAQLQGLDDWLAQADQTNWQQYMQEDPIGAQSAWMQREQVKDARAKLSTKIDASVKASTEKAQQEAAQRFQETFDYAQKNIPGWTPQVGAKIGDFAVNELGFTPDELASIMSPKTYRTLHRLWALETAQRRQATPPPKEDTAEPVVPLAPVARGRAPATSGPSDRQPISAWMEMRNKQVSGRRR